MGRYAYERIVVKSASVRSCKQKLHRIPSELLSGSMPGMDALVEKNVSAACHLLRFSLDAALNSKKKIYIIQILRFK